MSITGNRPWTPESQADVTRLTDWANRHDSAVEIAYTEAESRYHQGRADAYRHAIRIITGESL